MAKSTTKAKTRGFNLPVPQSPDACADAIFQIGEIDRRLQRQDADLKDALAKVKRIYEEEARSHQEQRTALIEGVKIFCEANRNTLTLNGKTKTVEFTTGAVSWRLRPPSVKWLRGLDSGIIDKIFASDNVAWRNMVRTKHELNKDAMLANQEEALKLPGITIGSEGEDFAVEPFMPKGLEAAQ